MIAKYNNFINESLLDKMKGKSKDDLWKSFGYDKSFDTPEEFFLDVIKDMKIKEQTKYPDSVFWEKNGKILFEQDFKNKRLWVDNDKIWKVFRTIFVLNMREIRDLLKGLVEEHLNWKGLTPEFEEFCIPTRVEEHLKWKGLTPSFDELTS